MDGGLCLAAQEGGEVGRQGVPRLRRQPEEGGGPWRGQADGAETVLRGLGLQNVKVVVGDGSHGLREFAPYDAILVSAAAPSVPQSLLEQLGEQGRMVIPVGPAHAQELQLIRKQDGRPVVQTLEGCRFVPLIGAEGY